MRRLTVILAALTVAAVQTHAGILDWFFGSQAEKDNRRVAAMMQWYAESDVHPFIVSKHDAERLARTALRIDPPNAEARFQITALELSELGVYGAALLDAQKTGVMTRLAQDALTASFMKFGSGDTKRLSQMLDAMPPEAAAAVASTPASAASNSQVEQPRSAANRVLDDAIRAVENRDYSKAASYFDEISRLTTDSDVKAKALSVSKALRRLAETKSEADAQELLRSLRTFHDCIRNP